MMAERVETEVRDRVAALSANIKELRSSGRGDELACRILRERRFALESLQEWMKKQ